MLLLKLAILNITRNPRRSVITVLAIATGLAALIFLWGFSDGTTSQQRENVIRLFTGHVQIQAEGFADSLAPEKIIHNQEALKADLGHDPRVVAITPRMMTEALIGTSEKSRGILLIGIDPEKESRVTEFGKDIREGSFLQAGEDRQVIVGSGLADKLGLKLGQKVVIMAQAMDGTLAGYAYHIKAILHTGAQDIDDSSIYVTVHSAQELLGLEGKIHQWVVRLRSRSDIPAFEAAWRPRLRAEGNSLVTWDEIVPEVNQWVQWSSNIIHTILITVIFVIGVGIMNTILMSVFERTREIGVMMAIGTSPGQVIRLVLLETLVLELLGIAVGVVAGYLITAYFGKVGIHFHGVEDAFASSYMSMVTYTHVKFHHVVESIITLIAVTSFAGLYPAWKAAGMEPVKAIYQS